MLRRDKQEQKEQIIQAIADLDIMALVKTGLRNIISYICDDGQLTFEEFVEKTSDLFDYSIIKISKAEQLDYVGGKMVMHLTCPTVIKLTADLYFRNVNGEWILKQMSGQVQPSLFRDWVESEELETLRENKTIDYSIEPPQAKR